MSGVAALVARGWARRLLHDLASSAAAVTAAVDLLEPEGAPADVRRLRAASDALASRLALFRLAAGAPSEAPEPGLVQSLAADWLGSDRALAPLGATEPRALHAGLLLLVAAERRLARGRLILDTSPWPRLEGEGRLAHQDEAASAAWARAVAGEPDDNPAHAPLHLLVAEGWVLSWTERPGRLIAEARLR